MHSPGEVVLDLSCDSSSTRSTQKELKKQGPRQWLPKLWAKCGDWASQSWLYSEYLQKYSITSVGATGGEEEMTLILPPA